MAKSNRIPTASGGYLIRREKGDPALPGAGRKRNPFKEFISELGDCESVFETEGEELDASGNRTGRRVRVAIQVPNAMRVVLKMYDRAMKGDVQAAKWLSETAYGKKLSHGQDDENPLLGGFVVILPANGR